MGSGGRKNKTFLQDVRNKTRAGGDLRFSPCNTLPHKKDDGEILKVGKWLQADGLRQIEAWAKEGLSDAEIAEKMGISPRSFYYWKARFLQISDTIKRGREVKDRQVENAFLKTAIGNYTVERTTETLDESGEVIKARTVTRPGIPDTEACITWLTNRKREQWQRAPKEHVDLGPVSEFIKGLAASMKEYQEGRDHENE